MRHLRITSLLLLPALLVGLLATGAAADEHDRFEGLYFPAGMEGTGTVCPGEFADPGLCILDQGDWTHLPGGRIRIRGMEVLGIGLAYTPSGEVEPRKTGLDHVTANANVDQSFTGPTWGTWRFYDFAGNLMFRGTFRGRFLNGVPAVRYSGLGVGDFAGQHMLGAIDRVPDPWNMVGRIVAPGE